MDGVAIEDGLGVWLVASAELCLDRISNPTGNNTIAFSVGEKGPSTCSPLACLHDRHRDANIRTTLHVRDLQNA
jgi:hypothetical protein